MNRPDGPGSTSVLRAPGDEWASQQVAAMAAAWERGEPIDAGEWIAGHPGLDAEAAIRLIYEEVCLRREAGQVVHPDEVVGRFPQWREELEVLFGCDRLLQPRPGTVAGAVFPEVGESLGTFRLLAELGRGASGRTFLATEPTLADRPVVLKVISCDLDEHLTLARLQHTHIVPLFSEQSFPERGLRSLCMPSLGGTSLGQILTDLAPLPPARRRGRDLIEALDRSRSGPAFPLPAGTDSPYRRFLEQASYVQAVCWIAACLADALHHAHSRALIHMDLKPSNVLIAADGQPMLLDFHLARGPLAAGDRVADRLGGTPGWMSPEQSAALDAVRLGRPVPAPLDGRSDLYALGLLLHEALVGAGDRDRGGGRDRTRLDGNPEVGAGLADLVRKCLAPQASGRYRDAAALADDLRRHLNDLPLRGVANRSPVERWRKWRRRRPGVLARGLAWAGMVAALAVAAALTGSVYRQRAGEVETALELGRTSCAHRRYDEAITVLRRGLERAAPLPSSPLTRALSRQLCLAQRGRKAGSLHELADLIRFRYGLELPADRDATALLRHCRAIWGERELLLRPGAGDERLDPVSEQRIRTDLLELAVVWADLRIRLAPAGAADAARRDALRVLDEAERSVGSSPALDRRRRRHGLDPTSAPAFASDRTAGRDAPRTAWDHYDLGRSYLRSGEVEAAAAEFRRVLEERPQDFWSNFYQGLCAFQLGQFEESVAAFRTCIALNPGAAACYYNRALAHESLGRTELALADYSHALRLDPALTSARLNRGILLHRQGRHRDAILEFQQALEAPADPEALGRVHYNLSLAYQAQGEHPAARLHAELSEKLRRDR